MVDVTTWGWYQSGIYPGWDPLNQNNLDARLNGTSIDPAGYITFTMRDADGDGVIRDFDSGDGSAGDLGEYVIGPSTILYPAEIALYTGSTMVADGQVFTGLDIEVTLFTDGSWGARLMDYSIPPNIFPHEVSSVTLGTWNGVEYSGIYTAGVDQPLCFAAEAQLCTERGPRPAVQLQPGDRVWTLDAGWQALVWVGHVRASGQGGHRAPVLVPPGVLGARAPLRLSARHLVLLRSPRAELLFGTSEVLLPAAALCGVAGVRRAPCTRVTWVHLMTGEHQLLSASGVLCESYRPAPRAQASLTRGQWDGLRKVWDGRAMPAARPVLRRWQARALLAENDTLIGAPALRDAG